MSNQFQNSVSLESLKDSPGAFYIYNQDFKTEGVVREARELVFIPKMTNPSQPGECYQFEKSWLLPECGYVPSYRTFTDSLNHYRAMSTGRVVSGPIPYNQLQNL